LATKSVPTISYEQFLNYNTIVLQFLKFEFEKEDRNVKILIVILLINGPKKKSNKLHGEKKEEGTLMVMLLLTCPRN